MIVFIAFFRLLKHSYTYEVFTSIYGLSSYSVYFYQAIRPRAVRYTGGAVRYTGARNINISVFLEIKSDV